MRTPFRFRRRRLDLEPFAPLPEGGVLVGGAVRDALLGREVADLDWLVTDPERAARRAADALGGSVFALDERRGHWRVTVGGAARDYIRLDGPLDANLSRRDFTVNAMAARLDGRLLDPLDGRRDLRARRLRMTSASALRDDPVRGVRAARLATVLGFSLDDATRDAARALAAEQLAGTLPLSAAERVRDELDKLLLDPAAGRGVLRLDDLGLLDVYLPELAAARGVEQGGFHHLDVFAHSVEALHQLLHRFPDADPALRWATLLHDVGKPATRERDEDGRTRFYGHDKLGAELTRALLGRLRFPAALVKRAAALVRYHMLPLPRNERAARRFVHRRRALLPDLLSLMLADREAARGPLSNAATRRAYGIAMSRVLAVLDDAGSAPPPPLLDGREVMELLGVGSGPRIGEALRFLADAAAVGDVTSREEAVAALERYAEKQGWLRRPYPNPRPSG